MIIELMILLIAVGAGILFVAWTNSRRRNQDVQERREVADSTGKLKQELERTANEVIGRMENHITHLETMLQESERNRTQLEGRVLELKKLLKKTEGQSGEIRDLLARLDDAGAEVTSMQRKMDVVERKINFAMTTPMPVQQPVTVPPMTQPVVAPMTSPILPNTPPTLNPISSIAVPQIVRSAPPVQTAQPTQTAQSVQPAQPAQSPQPKIEPAPTQQSDFDKILEKSINDQPAQEKLPPVKPVDSSPTKDDSMRQKLTEVSAQLVANSPEVTPIKKKVKPSRSARDIRKAALDAIREAEEISAGKSKSPADAPQDKISLERQIRTAGRHERKIETTDSSIIKEMLLSGMSVEEVARETGIGRGAIELAQQMARRQSERR